MSEQRNSDKKPKSASSAEERDPLAGLHAMESELAVTPNEKRMLDLGYGMPGMYGDAQGGRRANQTAKGLDADLDKLQTRLAERQESPDEQSEFVLLANAVASISSLQKAGFSRLGSLLLTVRPFRWLGWIFLLMFALDAALALFKLEMMNPLSELKTIHELVDPAPKAMIGVMLVLWGGGFRREKLGLIGVKALSWSCLILGILYLGLTPLAIVDANRSDILRMTNLAQAEKQLENQLAQVRKRIETTEQPMALRNFAAQGLGQPLHMPPNATIEQLREKALTLLTAMENNKRAQLALERSDKRIEAWVESAKWILGALLSGIVFIGVFTLSGWARPKGKSRK